MVLRPFLRLRRGRAEASKNMGFSRRTLQRNWGPWASSPQARRRGEPGARFGSARQPGGSQSSASCARNRQGAVVRAAVPWRASHGGTPSPGRCRPLQGRQGLAPPPGQADLLWCRQGATFSPWEAPHVAAGAGAWAVMGAFCPPVLLACM